MNKIYIFKISSSKRIGSGHILRALKIASELNNKKVFFLTNNFSGNFNKLIKEYNYKILKNSENKFDQKKDLKETVNELKKIKGKKILIIDNYLNNLTWQKSISNYVDKVVIINDYFNKNYCDLYINENFRTKSLKKNIFLKKNCFKLIGLKYSIIGYKKLKKKFTKKNNIFIFFGGFDQKNLTFKVLKQLRFQKDLFFYVVTNNDYLAESIKHFGIKNVNFFSQKKDFYKILKLCNFAITSGGSTIWDMIYNNIPFIGIPTARNQINNLNELYKKKIIFLYKKRIDLKFEKYFINCLSKKKKIPNLIDGMGVKRVIKQIQKL